MKGTNVSLKYSKAGIATSGQGSSDIILFMSILVLLCNQESKFVSFAARKGNMNYLHDFREDIIKKKHNKNYWNNWDDWNILYRTLAYELSSSRDVESYGYVKMQVLKYFPNCKEYLNGTIALDIMNGWWFCFKTLFGLENRKSEKTKLFFKQLNEEIINVTEDDLCDKIMNEYKIKKEYIKSLLDYLHVVYTIGNITPVSNNLHADCFDSWEYKLLKQDWQKCTENIDYMEYFVLGDYSKQKQWWNDIKKSSDSKAVIFKYMNNRIELIKERGEKIVNRKLNDTMILTSSNL
ncbi:MAG: hypothetical protein PUB28_05550 [Roseburia sp.]|nr:hypothetical protein [Roseburia sp.]